jgi:hypothetical protein
VSEGRLLPAGLLQGEATLEIETSLKFQIPDFVELVNQNLPHQLKEGQCVVAAGNHQG